MSLTAGCVEVVFNVFTGPRPNFMFPESTHETYTMIAVESGSFDFEIADQRGTAAFGDLVFCPPNTLFKREAKEDIAFHVFYFHYHPDTEWPLTIPFGKVNIRDTERLLSTYAYLRKLVRKFGRSSTRLSGFLLSDLLFLCEMEKEFGRTEKDSVDPIMQLAAGYIHRHLFADLQLKQIAEKLGIGQSQLTRRFQAAYGTTPMEYVMRMRLEEVKRRLLETNETLEAIAIDCGFESGSYLSRVFRAKIGMTPSAFRKNYRI